MFQDYKIIAIVPAGRQQYLSVLVPYLLKSSIIDEYHLWINTGNPHDLDYINSLKDNFKLVKFYDKMVRPQSQSPFFKYCIDSSAIYLKFDDDICYVHENAIENLIKYRIENKKYFIIIANIINNGYLAHIHQKNGSMKFDEKIPCEFHNCVWKSAKMAENIHKSFLKDLINSDIEKYYFDTWTIDRFERIPINLICWFGNDFARFNGIIPINDEEQWLCCDYPRETNWINSICGTSLVAHHAFYRQRKPFCSEENDIDPRIIRAYRYISQNGINEEAINRILKAKTFT